MTRTLRDDLASLKIDRLKPAGYGRNPNRNRRSAGSFVIWVVTLSLLGAGGYLGYSRYDKIKLRRLVTVVQVQKMSPGEAENLLKAKGYLKARNQAMIGTKVLGRIEKVLVEEGAKVKKGDLLAVLEHGELQAVLESRQAQFQRAQAEFVEARASLKEKEHRSERAARLLEQRHISAEDLDKEVTEKQMASARVVALEASIKLIAAQVREAQQTLGNTNILAPFDGTIVSRDADLGETVTPGATGDSTNRGSLFTLADLDHLDVETDVNELLLSKVHLGQPAEIEVDAVPKHAYRGRLRLVVPLGDRTRGTIKVKVEIRDPDARLFPDLVARVRFLPDDVAGKVRSDEPILYLPKSALVQRAGDAFVWIVKPNHVLQLVKIEYESAKDELIQVKRGLNGSETVVIAPPADLDEDELVRTE